MNLLRKLYAYLMLHGETRNERNVRWNMTLHDRFDSLPRNHVDLAALVELTLGYRPNSPGERIHGIVTYLFDYDPHARPPIDPHSGEIRRVAGSGSGFGLQVWGIEYMDPITFPLSQEHLAYIGPQSPG